MIIRSKILLVFWLPFAFAATQSISVLPGTGATESQLANISLLLYTGETVEEYTSVLIGDASDLLDEIDPRKPTLFYIFGWTESPSSESVETVVNAYLERQDHNVILVNWEEIAAESYLIAFPSAGCVGLAIADGINKLVAAGLDSTTVHIVGHSLGAQIAGFVGRNADFRVPRITGLDPAGPGFYILVADLTSSDAEFVDLIHTDAGVYGTSSTKGTVSFFPNGGNRLQPGCPIIRVPLTSIDGCEHRRSWIYYAESLLDEDAFVGVKCGSYVFWNLGFCKSNTRVVMGYGTPTTATGKVYLHTNSESPYGQGGKGV